MFAGRSALSLPRHLFQGSINRVELAHDLAQLAVVLPAAVSYH